MRLTVAFTGAGADVDKVKWLSATSVLILAMGMLGCAQSAPQDAPSSAPTPPPTAAVFRPKVGDARQKPAANADFDGDWSVEWCDKTHPGSDCGGFNITRSEEHTSELQSLMRTPYAVFC